MTRLLRALQITLVVTITLTILLPGLLLVRAHPDLNAANLVATRGKIAVDPTLTAPPKPHVLHGDLAFRDGHVNAPPPAITADGGILVDIDTHTILWQNNPHGAFPPASTAKVLTSLVTMENASPDTTITVTPDALTAQSDETVMGIQAGERYTVTELLTGMLLVSGNDAARELAVGTLGMDRFIATMNAQEAALGLHDSHFANPVGLTDDGEYASAYDLAVIATTDVTTFPLLKQIVAETDTDLPATANHPDFPLTNLNQLLATYPGSVGIKPGWTGDAGPCLISMAVRNGHRLVGVLLNAPYVYKQSRTLLDWGFGTEGLPPLMTPDAG